MRAGAALVALYYLLIAGALWGVVAWTSATAAEVCLGFSLVIAPWVIARALTDSYPKQVMIRLAIGIATIAGISAVIR